MRGGLCGGYHHCTGESIIHEKHPKINSNTERGFVARGLASLGYSRKPRIKAGFFSEFVAFSIHREEAYETLSSEASAKEDKLRTLNKEDNEASRARIRQLADWPRTITP